MLLSLLLLAFKKQPTNIVVLNMVIF